MFAVVTLDGTEVGKTPVGVVESYVCCWTFGTSQDPYEGTIV